MKHEDIKLTSEALDRSRTSVDKLRSGDRMRVPFAAAGTWRDDVYNHRPAIALWLLLNLLDYGLTVAALPLGGHEWLLHSFITNLPVLTFALYKISLTAIAVVWLALWRWLRFLKWVNWLFVLVVASNIYDLIVRPVY